MKLINNLISRILRLELLVMNGKKSLHSSLIKMYYTNFENILIKQLQI